MTDVILVATIVAFFIAAALLVRALGFVVADSADEGGAEDGLQDASPDDAAPGGTGRAGPLPATGGSG